MREINRIVVHCLGRAYGNALSINQLHINRIPPFRSIGYHRVILNNHPFTIESKEEIYNGMIHPGRSLEKQGAHAKGFNLDSIGICLVGLSGDFTQKQFSSIRCSIIQDMKIFDVQLSNVVGHCELDPINRSYCPGINMDDFRLFIEDYRMIKLFAKDYII